MTQTATNYHQGHTGPGRTVVTVWWAESNHRQDRQGVFWARDAYPVRFELLWGIGKARREQGGGTLVHVDCAAALDPVPWLSDRAKRALCKCLVDALEAETGLQASQDALPPDRVDLLHV